LSYLFGLNRQKYDLFFISVVCALAKIQALLVFFWALCVGKKQMCLNVRLAFYTDR